MKFLRYRGALRLVWSQLQVWSMMRDVATMKEKAQEWLGSVLGWGRRRQSGSAEKLYS